MKKEKKKKEKKKKKKEKKKKKKKEKIMTKPGFDPVLIWLQINCYKIFSYVLKNLLLSFFIILGPSVTSNFAFKNVIYIHIGKKKCAQHQHVNKMKFGQYNEMEVYASSLYFPNFLQWKASTIRLRRVNKVNLCVTGPISIL